jgi:hypothetical protein
LRSACALTDNGSIWFGEYIIVCEAAPLRIYRLPPGSERAEVVHVFPPDFARHIHGVYLDPFDSSLWCLTGDAGSHSHILRSTDGFETSTTIGSGDQTWRAVSVQFRADAIYYATDAWDRQNWIYRIDRASGERTEVAPLDGPVYYSHRVGDDLFFAVAAEGQQPHLSPRATLWHLDSADGCSKVASFDKDVWPVAQFQPGTISFPRGPGEGAASTSQASLSRESPASRSDARPKARSRPRVVGCGGQEQLIFLVGTAAVAGIAAPTARTASNDPRR